ncbi:MAG: hypothetical protein AAGH19_05945, partial [Pseudomonadota bacterium]
MPSSLRAPQRAERSRLSVVAVLCSLLAAPLANAQLNPAFSVTLNTGPTPPNSSTVFPGEPTSLRVTLVNGSTTPGDNITGINFSGALQTAASAGLVIDGPSSISGLGCANLENIVLETTEGEPDILLENLTILPTEAGVAGSGECYVDLPIRAFSLNGASTSLNLQIDPGEVGSDQGGNSSGGPQAITVRGVQRPTISKRFSNGTAIVGGESRTLTITISNPDNNIDLTEVALIDRFPTADGAIIEPSGAAATGSCVSGGATVTLIQGSEAAVEVSGATVAAGESCTVIVPVQGRQTNGVFRQSGTNTILADSFSSREGPTPAADASAGIAARSPLAVQKSFSPAVLASGEQGTLTVRLNNGGAAPLEVTTFTDSPIGSPSSSNLNIADVSAITNSCDDADDTIEVVGGGQGFSVGGFAIPGNGACTITVAFTATAPTPDAPITYTNTINQGDVVTSDPAIVSQAASASFIVADRLRILKSVSPRDAAPGEAVRYRVTVQNFSATNISDFTIEDTLQNGSTLLRGGEFEPTLSSGCGALTTTGNGGDTSVRFAVGTLPARSGPGTPGECTVSFSVMIDPEATTRTQNVLNPGQVCLSDGTTCNRNASQSTNISLRNPVTFIKTFDGTDAVTKLEGTPVRLQLELRNFAPAAATDIVFSDTLPSAGAFQQLAIASAPNIANSCGGMVTATAGTTSVALNGGTVPAYNASTETPGVCIVAVDVVGPAGSYLNTAQATGNANNADGSTSPLTALGVALEDSATVVFTPALQASKSFEPTSASDGATSTLSVRFENVDGTQPITGIAATDPLPAGMVVADPPVAYSTCGGPPVVTAEPGASTVSISDAILAPGADCALVVNVEVSGTSDWTNEIPAGNITADGGLTNSAPVSATLLFEPPGVPLISKAINPGTIVPGQSSTLTITITNDSQDLTGVAVTDWFTEGGLEGAADTGIRIGPSPQAITSCEGGVVTAEPGGNNVRLSGASIAATESCDIQVQVTSTTVGTLTNRIPLDAIHSDQGATNSTSFAETTISTTADIGVTKGFEPAVVLPDAPAR